jgi:hypothetical protein
MRLLGEVIPSPFLSLFADAMMSCHGSIITYPVLQEKFIGVTPNNTIDFQASFIYCKSSLHF